MIFTVSEMELLCIFHAGTRRSTTELLEKAAGEMSGQLAGRRDVAHSAVRKLKQMRDDEYACLWFEADTKK